MNHFIVSSPTKTSDNELFTIDEERSRDDNVGLDDGE